MWVRVLSGCSVSDAESGPLIAASIAPELHSALVVDFLGGVLCVAGRE